VIIRSIESGSTLPSTAVLEPTVVSERLNLRSPLVACPRDLLLRLVAKSPGWGLGEKSEDMRRDLSFAISASATD
jgi:hypothetical protein